MLRGRIPVVGALALLVGLGACGGSETHVVATPASSATTPTSSSSSAASSAPPVVITLVGTNDFHGHVEAAPLFAGYLARLRAVHPVVLVDGGDMFQGTLESNLLEGAPVRKIYDALGYDAAAIGNHEFDYGPVGPASSPTRPSDDPFGALKALANPVNSASSAPFPFLSVNLVEGGQTLAWPNVRRSTIVTRGGLRIGIVGGTTQQTLTTTLTANVKTLKLLPLAEAAAAEIAHLRRDEHVDLVILAAHAGGKCSEFHGDFAKDACETDQEILPVAEFLARAPETRPNAIVAGHTHAPMATRYAGIPIVEAYSYGTAFDRVDFTVDPATKKVLDSRIFPPQSLCKREAGKGRPDPATCATDAYEGAEITRDQGAIATLTNEALGRAVARKTELLGVELKGVFENTHDAESSLGNLVTDLMREAYPKADVAIVNGGGLRAPLPAGKLSYGSLFEAFPFDNRASFVTIPAKRLRGVIEDHLRNSGSIFSFSGVSIRATCKNVRKEPGPGIYELHVDLFDGRGKAISDEKSLRVVASDFLFGGGDDFWGRGDVPKIEETSDGLRDALETRLRAKKALDPKAFLTAKPRFVHSGKPMKCARGIMATEP